MRAHCSSVYGSVTRGSSWMRVTVLENSKVDLARVGRAGRSGARRAGRGVRASGMWPSPANRPDVGSSPIQPAPGMYTSAQACRSVKSASGPLGPSSDLLSARELHQVAGHEARREPEPAQDLHQQPAAVAARAERLVERLLGRLHARLHAGRVGESCLQRWLMPDQEVDGAACRRSGDLDARAIHASSSGPPAVDLEVRGQVAVQVGARRRTGSARRPPRRRSRTG